MPLSPPQPEVKGVSSFRENSSGHQSLTSALDPLRQSGEECPNCGGGLVSSGCRLPSDGEKKNSHTSDGPSQLSDLPQSSHPGTTNDPTAKAAPAPLRVRAGSPFGGWMTGSRVTFLSWHIRSVSEAPTEQGHTK